MPCGSIIFLGRDAQDRQDLISRYMSRRAPALLRLRLLPHKYPPRARCRPSLAGGTAPRRRAEARAAADRGGGKWTRGGPQVDFGGSRARVGAWGG